MWKLSLLSKKNQEICEPEMARNDFETRLSKQNRNWGPEIHIFGKFLYDFERNGYKILEIMGQKSQPRISSTNWSI